MDLAVQCGAVAFAVLLEAQVDRGEAAVEVGGAVDHEPACQRVAATPLAAPAEAALRRVVEGVAAEVAVVPGLQRRDAVHRLEVARPPHLAAVDAPILVSSAFSQSGIATAARQRFGEAVQLILLY